MLLLSHNCLYVTFCMNTNALVPSTHLVAKRLDFVFGQRISISQLFNLSIGMALLQLIRRS